MTEHERLVEAVGEALAADWGLQLGAEVILAAVARELAEMVPKAEPTDFDGDVGRQAAWDYCRSWMLKPLTAAPRSPLEPTE